MQIVEANGAKIPALGLGTWQLNGSVGSRITEQALKLGYRHLDCALIYGNEREIGEGLHASGIKREDVFITTKVPHTELAPAALERAVKQSLANLRLSDVNLLLVHWPNPQIPLAETMGAMCKMKREGYAPRRTDQVLRLQSSNRHPVRLCLGPDSHGCWIALMIITISTPSFTAGYVIFQIAVARCFVDDCTSRRIG